MDPRLRELAALSALAALGCGLAAAQGDFLFVALFDAATIVTIIEARYGAHPDGYTLLLVGGGNAINATLYDKLNFNFIRDIAPVAGIERHPYVMVVNPSAPAKTVPSSSRMPRPIPASSPWRRVGPERPHMPSASCSR